MDTVPETTLAHSQDFRLFLQEELAKRCDKNPSYSLRAFSRHLGVSSSFLSALLRGKRSLTKRMKNHIGLKIGLAPEQLGQFKDHSKKASQLEFETISIDNYALISDWYHYAILELMRTSDFESDHTWIAKKLSLPVEDVISGIERLKKAHLISEDKSGTLIDISSGLSTNISGDISSKANRKLQIQILEKAIDSIQCDNGEERSNTSITMAINKDDLPQAKEMIKKFRRQLMYLLEKNPNPKDVYHLAVALNPVSRAKENNEN